MVSNRLQFRRQFARRQISIDLRVLRADEPRRVLQTFLKLRVCCENELVVPGLLASLLARKGAALVGAGDVVRLILQRGPPDGNIERLICTDGFEPPLGHLVVRPMLPIWRANDSGILLALHLVGFLELGRRAPAGEQDPKGARPEDFAARLHKAGVDAHVRRDVWRAVRAACEGVAQAHDARPQLAEDGLDNLLAVRVLVEPVGVVGGGASEAGNGLVGAGEIETHGGGVVRAAGVVGEAAAGGGGGLFEERRHGWALKRICSWREGRGGRNGRGG